MGGFELPAAQLAPPSTPEVGYLGASSSAHSAVLTPPQQPPKLSSVPLLSAERAYGTPTGSLLQRAPVALSSSLVSSAPHKPAGVADLVTSLSAGNPESPSAVGWQGLLEFSETSGCSGVLGPKTTVRVYRAVAVGHSGWVGSESTHGCQVEIARTTPRCVW